MSELTHSPFPQDLLHTAKDNFTGNMILVPTAAVTATLFVMKGAGMSGTSGGMYIQ